MATSPRPEAYDPRAFLAAIIDSSDDAIIGKTLDGIIVSWNASAERIFGYSVDEVLGEHISLIIPPDRRDEEFIILGKVRNGQRIDHFETIRQAKDGSLIDISLTVSPVRTEDGKVVGASKIIRDIRDAKRAEHLSAYMAAIVSSSDDAIVSKNLDGTITSWNASAERMFGYTPDEAIGQHITLIIPPEKLGEEYAILGRVKSGQRIEHFETTRRTKSGDPIEISLTVSPIRDQRGRIIGASKVARDITSQMMTERALVASNQRRDDFLANMSHELRTPLNAVIGLSDIMARTETLSPKGQQCVSMIGQSGRHLLSLVNNLLDFSKMESGNLEFEAVEFHLPELLEQTLLLQEADARAKGLGLTVDFHDKVREHYVGDPLRIQQIVTNLVANAIKFTAKGAITVSIGVLSETDDTSVVTMAVADTGCGIPAEKVTTIFEKFMQADVSTARTHGGSGLGLSICKALAEGMGGTISVTSVPGLGATFCVELPLRHGQRTEAFAAGAIRATHRKDILVVEDFEPNVLVVTSLLDDLNYSYDVANNGMEALRKSERNTYDVILMDVQMPGMDGFETTRRIRDIEEKSGGRRSTIIALTAHVQSRGRTKCLQAGMDDFIPKPFDAIHLETMLSGLLAGR